MSPREIWCNEAQERYVLAIAPGRPRAVPRRSASASAARSRSSAARPPTQRLVVADAQFGNEPVDMELDVLLGKPPQMTRDVARTRARRCRRSTSPAITLREAAYRVLQLPAVADKTFLVTIGDRTRRRPLRARSDGRSVAGAGRRRRGDADGLRRLRRRGDGDRRAHAARADRRAGVGPDGGRARRSPTSRPRGDRARSRDVKLSANWMAPAGHPGEDAALYDTVRAVGDGALPGARHQHPGRQGLDVDAHDVARRTAATRRSPRRCR